MSGTQVLKGSCTCGRNQYMIALADDSLDQAEVYFDSSRDNRRSQGAPLTAWLRVPLTWYQSQTHSFFPDETHATIRRTFTPHHAPHSQRKFCGFCGTHLTFWTDHPREEAEYMSVTLGSLFSDDLRLLEDLELLPPDVAEDVMQVAAETKTASATTTTGDVASSFDPTFSASVSRIAPSSAETSVQGSGQRSLVRSHRHGTHGGIPWFEEMLEGSHLGRIMRSRRGFATSDDKSSSVEWEISEWREGGTEEYTRQTSTFSGAGKRKVDDVSDI